MRVRPIAPKYNCGGTLNSTYCLEKALPRTGTGSAEAGFHVRDEDLKEIHPVCRSDSLKEKGSEIIAAETASPPRYEGAGRK